MFLTMLLLAAVSCSIYHFIIKTIPDARQPFAWLAVAYLVSAAACLLLLLVFEGPGGSVAALKSVGVRSVSLGLALAGVETGIFFLYRLGSQLSVTPLLVSIAQTLIIVLAGAFLLKERITLQNMLGIAVSVAGIWLMTKK